jgi:hypothetical protein
MNRRRKWLFELSPLDAATNVGACGCQRCQEAALHGAEWEQVPETEPRWVGTAHSASTFPRYQNAEAGFGNAPQSFALRVRIIGYSSPRWRGAKNATEADRLNFKLSSKRAGSVQAFVEKELRARLGANIKIDYAVSQMEPRAPQGIEIGSYGTGSVHTLVAAGGNRKDNSEIHRRVEVMIEKITTTYTTGGVSLPPLRIPGKTDSWALGVTKLRMLAVGAALGSVEIVLRNRLTDKQMFATADLYGGGIGGGVVKAGNNLKKQFANAVKNNLMQAVGDFIGRGEVFFMTKNKMGFDDFNGEFIRVGKAVASLGVKAVYAYTLFPFISHHPKMLVFQKKITVGRPDLEGWVVSGKLRLRGPNPGDWSEYDRSGVVHSSYDKSWQETLLLTYPTGKWELLPADKSRLTDFVATWVRRYL